MKIHLTKLTAINAFSTINPLLPIFTNDLTVLQEHITTTKTDSITCMQAVNLLADEFTILATTFAHFQCSTIEFSSTSLKTATAKATITLVESIGLSKTAGGGRVPERHHPLKIKKLHAS